MVRTFARGSDQIRLEQRYDTQTAEFLLVIEHHDGYRETKRFAEALTFREWRRERERRQHDQPRGRDSCDRCPAESPKTTRRVHEHEQQACFLTSIGPGGPALSIPNDRAATGLCLSILR